MNLVRFDSPNDLYQKVTRIHSSWEPRFVGPTTYEKLGQYLRQGDTRYVAEAEKTVHELEEFAQFVSKKRAWQMDVAGAMPNVPAFLAGAPRTMRRVVKQESTHAPIEVYVCISCSAGIEKELLVKRGIALLALSMILSTVRPTELWVFSLMDSTVNPAVRLPTQPPDFGVICTCLADPAFDRGLMHSYGFEHGRFTGEWYDRDGGSLASCKRLLADRPNAVIFPPIHLRERAAFERPKEWVKQKLTEILETNEQ